MDLQTLRSKIPELSNFEDDDSAISYVHERFYPDMPRESVAKALGVKPPEPPKPEAGFMRRMGDVATSVLGKGVIGVGETAVGLGDLVSGGRVGKFMEDEIGYRPKEARQIIDDNLMSDASRQEAENFRNADGFLGKAGVAVRQPWMLLNAAGESAPSMLAGGAVGRGVQILAPRMGSALAAGVGEGVVTAGQAAEQIRQESPDGLLSGRGTVAALGSGAVNALITRIGAKVSNKLGIGDLDSMIVAGSRNAGVRKNIVRATLEGMATEGVLEELPQSIQEQVWQNWALGRPLEQGVDEAAVMGLFTGALMGGGAAAVTRPGDEIRIDKVAPNGPLSKAVNVGLEHTAQQVDEQAASEPELSATGQSIRQQNAQMIEAIRSLPPEQQKAPAPDAIQPGIDDLHRRGSEDLQALREFPRRAAAPAPVAQQAASPVEILPAEPAPRPVPPSLQPDYTTPGAIRENLDEIEQRNAQTRAMYRDVVNPKGEPFKNRTAAARAAQREGGEVVPVNGGFVVRVPMPGAQKVGATMGTRIDVRPGPETTAQDVMRFGPETGTKGIPRAQMPQIQSQHHGALTNFLNARGIEHETTEVDPDTLKPTQAEFIPAKVEAAKESAGNRSIIVSSDGHVLDGHHQWMAAKETGEPVKAIVFDAPIDQLLGEAQQFPSTTTDDQNQAPAGQGAPAQAQEEGAPPAGIEATGRPADEGRTGQPGSTEVQAAGVEGQKPATEPFDTGVVKVGLAYGGSVYVKRSDLDGPRTMLPLYTADGKRKDGAVHRENLDPTGEKLAQSNAEIADNPLFDVITRKGGMAFANRKAAQRELNSRGMSETHEVVEAPRGQGFIGKRKAKAEQAKPKQTDNDIQQRIDQAELQGDQAPAALSRRPPAQVLDNGEGEFIVRDPGDKNGQGTNLARFEVGADGKPVRVKFFFESQQTRDFAREAIDTFIASRAPDAAPATTPQPTPNKRKPTGNKIFTDDAAEKARAVLRKKLGNLNVGIDPEILQAGITLAGYHIEKGARTFVAYAEAMLKDLGDGVKPYLKSWYMGVKYDPRAASFQGMDDAATVDAANLDDFGAPEPTASKPEQVQNATTEEQDGRPAQPDQLPNADKAQDQPDAPPGNGYRQPLDAGLAGQSEGTVAGGRVPAGPEGSGRAGARGSVQRQQEAPGEARDRAGRGPEPGATDDFDLTGEDIGRGGLTRKYRDNIAAIRILKALEAEGRNSTADERKALARYVGWGALKGVFDPANKQWAKEHAELKAMLTDAEWKSAIASTLNAHYTSPVVVTAIFDALQRLGATRGRLLEPSVGSGNFFGLMPKEMRKTTQLFGVELDLLTSKIAAGLYPSAKIRNQGFEDFDVPGGFFDIAAGKPPFGNETLVDMHGSPYSGWSIHNYFFAKTIDKLRPGGVMAMVVSHNFLDAQDSKARQWIAKQARLVGAVRLPRTAFKENAGTEVVTDIVIFQKTADESEPNWLGLGEQRNTNPKTGDEVTHKINRYFLDNPQNILGTPSAGGTMYSANEYTVEPSGDLAAQLADWSKTLPEGIFEPIDRTEKMQADEVPDNVKVGSFFVANDGSIKIRAADEVGERRSITWTPPNEKAAARVKGMIRLRDALRAQMRLERSQDATSEQIEKHRRDLNAYYDEFQKANGYLNDPTNRRLFVDDTEASLLLALEFDYDKGISPSVAEREGIDVRKPSATKADIFKRRVLFPPQDNIAVSSARDAMLQSLNFKGRLDLPYMAKLYGKDEKSIVEELGDLVFTTPDGQVVTYDEYLSGDVKTKLSEAEAAARTDAGMKRNVEALRKVIPEDKKPSEIHAAMGAKFVPGDVLEAYAMRVSGAEVKATYVNSLGQWLFTEPGRIDRVLNNSQWGTPDVGALEIMRSTIAGKSVIVTQTVRNSDGSTTTIVKEKETEAAREKQRAMKEDWQAWLWSDPERADRLSTIYNEEMNRWVERRYDGSHLTLPGKVPDSVISLLEHQKNGVWRALQSRQILLDHVVGAGKTFQMVAIAMELRRMGIARKPFFAVPNHLTLQWRSEFARMYPGANVLAATPEDFSKGNREKFFSKIITGDWDAVIVGHSSLKKIALPPDTEKAVLEEQVREISDAIEEMKRARGDSRIVSDMQRIKKNLEGKMKGKLAALGERDKVVTFDELGVDAIFVDELHEFKNLYYMSTMDRVPGMGNPAGSDKAFDLFVKVQWLNNLLGDQAPIIGATGTPVSNSLVEMFNMQRFMQYPKLKQEGLHVFDAWARQFGSVENVYEVAPSGTGYRSSNRFSKFKNLGALMAHYNDFADVVTLDDLKAQEEAKGKKFPVPKIRGGRPTIVVADRSPQVAKFMGVPELKTDGGQPLFGLNASDFEGIKIESKDGKHLATATLKTEAGQSHTFSIGIYDTEAEARMAVVEKALTPEIAVDPNSILGQFGNLKQLMKESKGKVNALSLTGAANKAGLDYRLIDPSAPDFPGSKINLAVGNMLEEYRRWTPDKGAQLVFCDLSVPLSERNSMASKAKRLYVREDGAVVHKKGTMHTVEGMESLPFFVVQKGSGATKAFDLYDAASGLLLKAGNTSKAEAVAFATDLLQDEAKRQRWIDDRERAGEITQEQIDDYNDANEIDTEETEAITRQDIAGISAATGFSVYDDIKAKLIARGVPESEIAFIHDYSTPTAKDKLFKAVNRGEIRFLLGSTPKMGAGTNVQQRLVALHHIDAPWRPSDLEQREGRIIRRGNKLYERDPEGFEIGLYRYATKKTYDTRRWQILEHKARGIEQLRNYDGTTNEIDDIDGEASNAADMKAAASGDPLILKETQLRNEVKRLENLQAAHADSVATFARKSRDSQQDADKWAPAEVAKYQALIDRVDKHPVPDEGMPTATDVDGQAFKDRKEFTQAIARVVAEAASAGSPYEKPLRYRGLKFKITGSGLGGVRVEEAESDFFAASLGAWLPNESISATGIVQRLSNYVDRLSDRAKEAERRIQTSLEQAALWREESKKPFEQAQELADARTAHKNVQRLLIARGPEIPDRQRPMLERGLQQQRDALREAGFGDALDELMAFSEAKDKGSDALIDKPEGEEKLSAVEITPAMREKAAGGVPLFTKVDANENAEQTSAYGPASEAHQRLAADLQARLARRHPGVVFHAVDAGVGRGGPNSRSHQAIATVAKRLFGHEVVFVEFDSKPLFNGAMSTAIPGTLFIRVDSTKPFMAVLGHELLHQLRRDTPGIYDTLAKRLNTVIKGKDQYSKALRDKYATRGSSGLTDEYIDEELKADIVGDFFEDPEFWSAMAKDQPGLFRRVVNAILKFLDDLSAQIAGLRPFGTDAYLKDIAAARAAVVDAFRQYSGAQVGAMADSQDGIRLSIADDLKDFNQQKARDAFADLMNNAGARVSWFERTLGTQYAKSEKHPEFKPVFEAVQQYLEDTSTMANEAADNAPGILPKLDTWKDLFKDGLKGKDAEAISAPIFQGTLDDLKVYTDQELRDQFKLNDKQIGLYGQFREAVDDSLDQVATAEVLRLLGNNAPPSFRAMAVRHRKALRGAIDQFLTDQIEAANPEDRPKIEKLRDDINLRYERVQKLKNEGYAPLMRFGQFAVNVADKATGESLFFGLYENRMAANRAARMLAEEFPDGELRQGVLSQEQFKLFQGVPLDSLEMFAQAIGADRDEVFQDYLRLVKNNRSAMKRLIHRKGTAGFSEDIPRILASFITSNARMAAGGLNMPYASDMARQIKAGDVKDEAIKLIETVQNPQENAAAARSFLFFNFIGGSIASAGVNMTQPLTMTLPYLTQWGGAKAVKRLLQAAKEAATGNIASDEIAIALKKADDEGITSPQEIHYLQAQAMGKWGTNDKIKKAAFLWGAPFSLAEQWNRRVTFIAAYRTAKEEGIANPFKFAEKAVVETQGLYNRANAPNWARNPIGATALTFKQYSIHYLEWMGRMWKSGPEGKRAVVIALLLLAAVAGADGLPFAEDADDLFDTAAQAMGYSKSAKDLKREVISEGLGLGDEMADVFMRGVSGASGMPFDLSMRMSMGNLIPATAVFQKSSPDKSRDVMEVAGASGALAKQYMDAGAKALDGDIGGALKTALPIALQNMLKALDMWKTGEYRDTRDRKVMDTDDFDGIVKFLGFQPAEIARESRKVSDAQQQISLTRVTEAEIADQWARGVVNGNDDDVQEAISRLRKWNQQNPSTPISINRAQIARRVRNMRMGRAERVLKSAPKEMRGNIASELKE